MLDPGVDHSGEVLGEQVELIWTGVEWRVFSELGFLGTLAPVGDDEFLAKFADREIEAHGVIGYQPWPLVEFLVQFALMSPA
jgi:hypothetical protein